MYQLYEKIPKTKQHMQGSRLIDNGENPFKDGPCLLCVAAADTFDRSVFGVTKQGMRMARLRVRGEVNAGYDLSSFPVKFLSMKLDMRDEENKITSEERIQSFVSTYLVPLISSNGKKIDCIQAMRQMRNVNILSYCDGTITVQDIEDCLIGFMQQMGYTEEEIAKIQAQMCMFPIATNRLEGKQKSTCISFKDINDGEVDDDITPEIRGKIESSPISEGIVRYSERELAYYMSNSGAHSIKAYLQKGKALPVCLSSIISKALQNSISNATYPDDFAPVTVESLIEDCAVIMQGAEKGISLEDLFVLLDGGLKYENARILSELEVQLLDQLDESYDDIIRSKRTLDMTTRTLEAEKERSRKTEQAIEENCTEVTRLKILAARGYQFGKEQLEMIENAPSDRAVLGSRSSEVASRQTEERNPYLQKAQDLQTSVDTVKALDREIADLEAQKEK